MEPHSVLDDVAHYQKKIEANMKEEVEVNAAMLFKKP